ncbi:c-type cytochrome [Cupriavidus sp. 2SB]|uniref:c-type cytochrome n=1 Tax=Cupriavidus sp. 2SB TaxID=2502199 RepID=UPI0010FA554F|nr:c-type cytochrome [Cupriavidus sp. 2SB]
MFIVTFLTPAASYAAVDVVRAKLLASKNACLGCHAVSMKLVGPSYKEVAAKYKGTEPAKLADSIKAGGSGKWGQLEMPPQPNLSDADAKLLAEWVLNGSPDK